MKRTLLLMRHAKSSWKEPVRDDAKRPLSGRGRRDAPMMGERLKAAGYRCDRIISSPALRAWETAKAVAGAIGYRDALLRDARLYMAQSEDFLEVIAGVEETIGHLMLVGHNPGTEEFFADLTGERVAKFPTAAYALIAVEESWSSLSKGVLLRFDYPKSTR